MGQRHKYADVIIAWANGAEIEYRLGPHERWSKSTSPSWQEDCEYRVKPPARKYRVALFRFSSEATSRYTACTDIQEEADSYEQHEHFVRWLTDWVEYAE